MKDTTNPTAPATVSSPIQYVVTNPLTSATLTPNLPSPRALPAQIILTAAANGGAQDQYAFYDGATPITGFSTSQSATWTPNAAGTHNLTVVVKDISVTPPTIVTSPIVAYTIDNQLSAASLSGNPPSPVPVNTLVTLTATATGGAAPQYKFTATDPGGNTTTVQAYSLSATCSWTPTLVGNYTLWVYIQAERRLEDRDRLHQPGLYRKVAIDEREPVRLTGLASTTRHRHYPDGNAHRWRECGL